MKKYRNTKTGEIVEVVKLTRTNLFDVIKRLHENGQYPYYSEIMDLCFINEHDCEFCVAIGQYIHFDLSSGKVARFGNVDRLPYYEELESHVKTYHNAATGEIVSVIPVNVDTTL